MVVLATNMLSRREVETALEGFTCCVRTLPQSFTAPETSPLMSYFWKANAKTIGGIVDTRAAAVITPPLKSVSFVRRGLICVCVGLLVRTHTKTARTTDQFLKCEDSGCFRIRQWAYVYSL
jgi:hypothetical protein